MSVYDGFIRLTQACWALVHADMSCPSITVVHTGCRLEQVHVDSLQLSASSAASHGVAPHIIDGSEW